ncbi:TIGR00730 family Rossman fold protein [Oceanicola sp. S124]|uniref:LOG family protein n=1 Tax=Oceanicola sp. S124 TaxID=1042378 RepID=UPI000255813D|nr:TIGR00730 family Rossman fold protein [Oceanicola sp. S124]
MTKASICVYCGSRPGLEPAYLHQAGQFGRLLARNGWQLVYGAGDVGLMGEVARTAREEGADLFGVIPQHLLGVERGRSDLARLVVTQTMHERKKVMFMNCDAAVVMPGGAGTLDEFFEILTWRQLGLHQKPILLMNVAGYWDPLLQMLEKIAAQGFAETSMLHSIRVVEGAQEAATSLARHFAQQGA